ncbi:hypothetical protein DINO107042_06095 [Dichelobacter nodosus]|nr:hypothetical protein AKG33_00925 [Dichelobacter nodosus]
MDLDDQAHDLAYFFVKGSNPRWSKDETFVQTTSYLTNHLENLSEDDAQHVAARAIAEFESREYSPIWRIDIDTSSSYAIFINRYVEDKGIQKHIISLAELVEFIENRIKKEC